MNFEELNEWIGILFEKRKKEEIRAKLPRFKQDEWLIKQLGSQFEGKELKNVTLEDFIPLVNMLEKVVLPEYPLEDAVKYAPLYFSAVSNETVRKRYPKVLTHLNEIKTVEPSLVSEGIIKNPDFKYYPSSSGTDPRPYVFNELSYLERVRKILEDYSNEVIEFPERLANFGAHLRDLKEKGIDLIKLFGCGYARVLEKLDGYNRSDQKRFPDVSTGVTELLKKLDTEGFNIYHESNISKIAERLRYDKGVKELSILSTYLSKEAIMYISGFHLKE
ncbi:MAG: hypothetical protein PHU53_07235 [Thermoplasmata archaeon]|nr:hypothetical protein [Thermoplasmata archaeon]